VDGLAYDRMREELADLEHEQWVHWTEYMLANLTPENIARWKGQCLRGYSALTEREKESDRSWADRVLEIIATYTMDEYPTSMLVLEIAQRPDCEQALQRVMGMVQKEDREKEDRKIRSILDREGVNAGRLVENREMD
jgi:hypothetical protein